MKTGRFPISMDKNCLTCMQDGRDTKQILQGFKTACLSYAPSDVSYRDMDLSRTALIGIRR